MDVTDILRDRMHEPAGLPGMMSVSVLLHGALVIGLLFAPRAWLQRAAEAPRSPMMITLGGGGEGPRNGGMTPVGGRAVQVQTPPEAVVPKREAVLPPAAKTPEMTVPRREAKPVKAAVVPPVKQAPDEAHGRTPTHGPESRSGNELVETGARGLGFGLSTGGGPGTGSTLDVADFCCPQYIAVMIERIRSAWSQHAEVAGSAVIKFTIERDGRITETSVEKTSGYETLDIAARTAVAITRQLPPLPQEFPNPTLTVHLNFQYQR
jgi:TonB family protein